jgi:hypothetical protein
MKLPKTDRSKIHIPYSVVYLFEADVLLQESVAGTDPMGVPSDPSVATDKANFVMRRIFDEW